MSWESGAPSLEEPLLPRESSELGEPCDRDENAGVDAVTPRTNDDGGAGDQGARSRNINLVLAYTVLSFAGRSLWSQSALSAFVYLLRDENPEYVGYLTAVMGVAQLLASFPSGYLADKHRRDALLHTASAVGLIAAGVTTAAVLIESYALLGAALAVWGCFWGMANTAISALFADSIRDGDRSRFFTHRMILVKVGNLMGPLAALLMFAIQGDSWTTRDCAFVMGAGQIVCLPAMAILCFLSDDYAVVNKDDMGINTGSNEALGPLLGDDESQSEGDKGHGGSKDDLHLINTDHSTPEHSSDEDDIEVRAGVCSADEGHLESSGELNRNEQADQICCCCIPESRRVPALISAADLIGGIAAGMSVRYFPIFFLDNIHLDPVRVQIVYAVALVFQIMMSRVALKGGERYGRCQMAAALKWAGVSCFFLLILSYQIGLPTIIVVSFFIGRMCLMNSTGALTKSIVMDNVPRNERGKWSSLESVNMFSWAGSAAIGGWLVQTHGIVFNFCVTATLQVISTIPLIMLFGKVKDESGMRHAGESLRQRIGSEGEAEDNVLVSGDQIGEISGTEEQTRILAQN
mmetsp:Transcript_28332/g.83380  ORF Transcript_28332/g.83380 Transcript_28332/m.83380 type:complete len:578 (-) Transcript_28332:226-1959(-)